MMCGIEGTEQSELEQVCNTISQIMAPLKIDLMQYSKFDVDAVNLSLKNLEIFMYVSTELKFCPIKLLQLSEDALFIIISDYTNIANNCRKSGISTTDLIALPKAQVEMILTNQYYVNRLPVLTRAYFLQPQQFLDASVVQKQAWLEHPASIKLLFNKRHESSSTIDLAVALRSIYEHTSPILGKLVSTEALLYLKELSMTPWDIVLQLQESGLTYAQCRLIFKILTYINDCFSATFMGRFTNHEKDNFLTMNLNKHFMNIKLKFGSDKFFIVYEAIEDYQKALKNALEATKSDELSKEFSTIVASIDKDETINRIASRLNENNIFCKHLRLYKSSNNKALGKKIVFPDIRYVSSLDYSGDADIFATLSSDTVDSRTALSKFQAINYDARNTQEVSVLGYAVQTDNVALIEQVCTSIKRRSKAHLQQFLIQNGFVQPPSQNMLFTFSNQGNLDACTINSIHPDTGDTPLLTAIRQRNSAMALALIVLEADLDISDSAGLNAETLAESLDIQAIVLDIGYKKQYSKLQSTTRLVSLQLY